MSSTQRWAPRLWRTLVASACLSFFLASCSSVGAPINGDWGQTGIVRIGITDEPDSLNPLYSHTSVADDIAALTLAPFFRYDEHGNYLPELAQRVPSLANGDISANGKRITLRLRPGLVWQDGAALDMRDLVFTWHAVMNPRNSTKLRAGWQNIRTIKLLNAQTAVVELLKPDATILALFAGGGDAAYPLMPAHLLAKLPNLNQADWNAHLIGDGPWKLQRWEHGSSLSFVPNPLYWRGRPALRGIRLVILPNVQTQVAALQAHEIDAVMNAPIDRLPQLRHLQGLHLQSHRVASYLHLDFQCQDPWLKDPRARRAIIEAINWKQILRSVYLGNGELARTDIPPSSWAAPAVPYYRYDQRDAARLFDAVGWRADGQGMRHWHDTPVMLTLMSGTANPLSQRAEMLMAQDLQKMGIGISIKNAPANYLFAEQGPLYTGKYQLAWMSDTRAPDPDNEANWSSQAIPPNGGNTVFLRDTIVDRTAAAARTTLVPAERKKLYAREELRLHDLTPSLTFIWQRETLASWGSIAGLRPATFYSSFWNSWEWHHA